MPKKRPPTPLDHASKLRYDLIEWHKLTQKEITETSKNGISFLVHAVKYGHWINLPPKLKEFSLIQPSIGQDKIIHLIAEQDRVRTIPKNLVTQELLSLKGNAGNSVYHLLAQEDRAHHIDKSLWTKKALTLKSNNGHTPLHCLVQCHPELLPEDITLEDILIQDNDGDSALYMWAQGSHWSKIPDKFLTKQTLGLKVDYGGFETIIDHIAENFKNNLVLGSSNLIAPLNIKMKKILSKVNDKTLHSLGKDGNPDLAKLISGELAKRKLVKELSQSKQFLEV